MITNTDTKVFLELSLMIFVIFLLCFLPIALMEYWKAKRGKKVDIREEILLWTPFDFLELHFDIKRPNEPSLMEILTKGFREDYFYTHVSDKLNLKEKDEYIRVNKKIRNYEKIWHFVLWITPVLAILSSIVGIENVHYIVIFTMYFALIQLARMPYQKELVPIQISILKKMYFHLYKENLDDDLFIIRSTKLARSYVPSNYVDLVKVINEINKKHHI